VVQIHPPLPCWGPRRHLLPTIHATEVIALAVEVVLIPEGRSLRLDGPLKVSELLRLLGLSTDEAVVVVEGKPVPEDGVIADGTRVEVVRVLSGGS
jgi:sulfur carrier protein ThiS